MKGMWQGACGCWLSPLISYVRLIPFVMLTCSPAYCNIWHFTNQVRYFCFLTSWWITLTLISWDTTLILSTTLKFWGKLHENVSWFNTFPSLSSISLQFIRKIPSLSSAQCVRACGSTMTFRARDVISQERLPQMWDKTDTMRSAPIFRRLPNSASFDNVHDIFLYHSLSFSI